MIAMPKSLQTAAGWKLTLTAKKAEPGPAGALGGLAAAAAAATPLGDLLGDAPVTITHTMFRADIAVSKGLGLDGGRVRILVSNMPFRILQQVLTAYEKAQDQATKSGASGPLVGSLKLFWRMALPYPGLDEAADLVQSALGVGDDDTDVAANFVVTSLAAESVTVGYGLVIEGVDQAWHTLNTVRLEAPKVIKSAADVTALCKALKIETGPGKPSADLLGAAMTAITGLGGGAGSAEGGDSSGGGEAAITEKERLLDRLSDLQTAITDEGKTDGLGAYLIDNGRVLIGRDIETAFNETPVDLRDGLDVISVQAIKRDPADTTGAEQSFTLRIRGNAAIKPGRVLKFRYKKASASSASTGLGYADAVVGMVTEPLGLSIGGDPVCLYVKAVRHQLSSSIGFITEVDGVACGTDAPQKPKRQTSRGSTTRSTARGADGVAEQIHSKITRLRPQAVDVAELRAFRSQAGNSPGQTGDVIIGLGTSEGQMQPYRTVDVDRDTPQRANAIPYITPFAWGPFGMVLPRYPGMRLAVLRPEGSADQAIDAGALWWSGDKDNSKAGPSQAEDGDYWLILPVDPEVQSGSPDDAKSIPTPAGNASHDLTDKAGRRMIQLRELTLRVGEWTLKTPDKRPELPEHAGGLRIEGKDGTAFLEIDIDGNITLKTPKSITLDGGEGITLTTSGVTVEIKDGKMDVS